MIPNVFVSSIEMNLLLCNTFINSPWKTSFIFYGNFFSVQLLFKSMYLKWDFYCNCSQRLKNLIALTSEVFHKKLSGLCVWSGSPMQRCSKREMNCINSNKLQETYYISESSLQLWFRGLRYKGALKSRTKMPTKTGGRWRTQTYESETCSLRLLSGK